MYCECGEKMLKDDYGYYCPNCNGYDLDDDENDLDDDDGELDRLTVRDIYTEHI